VRGGSEKAPGLTVAIVITADEIARMRRAAGRGLALERLAQAATRGDDGRVGPDR
jgi:hypothetical protein